MQLLDELTGLASSKFAVIKSILTMVKLEARLASLSIFPLLLNLCVLFVVTITTWTTIMVLIGYGIYTAANSVLIALVIVFLINSISLLLLAKYLFYNLKKMSFEKTRKFLIKQDEGKHNERKKKSNQSPGANGKNITPATSEG